MVKHLPFVKTVKQKDGDISGTMILIYYIADLPVTRLQLLTNKSENIAVPYASLRSLILFLALRASPFSDSLLRSSWDARLTTRTTDTQSHKKRRLF